VSSESAGTHVSSVSRSPGHGGQCDTPAERQPSHPSHTTPGTLEATHRDAAAVVIRRNATCRAFRRWPYHGVQLPGNPDPQAAGVGTSVAGLNPVRGVGCKTVGMGKVRIFGVDAGKWRKQ
jgi:hypothetical protein